MPITPPPIASVSPTPTAQPSTPVQPPIAQTESDIAPRAISEPEFMYVMSCLFYYHAAKMAAASLVALDPTLVVSLNSNAPEVRTQMQAATKTMSEITPIENPEESDED